MTTKEVRGRASIGVSRQTKEALDVIKHPGQSYDGLIKELVGFWRSGHRVEEVKINKRIYQG